MTPRGWGRTVDAPLDEYDDLAWRLMRGLTDAEEPAAAVRDAFPRASEELVGEVLRAWHAHADGLP